MSAGTAGALSAEAAPERDRADSSRTVRRRGLTGIWVWAPSAAAAAWLLALVARFYDPHLIVDDAFISFRYADNLAHGLGMVYNPGERVEGYSNFLWTLLLAAGARLGLDIPQLSIVLALAAALAAVALLGAWSYRLFAAGERPGGGADGLDGMLLAALPPLLYAAIGSQARYVVSGMETLLFGLLVAAAAYLLAVRDAPLAAGGVFALAAMTRPEGGMYGLVAGGLTLLPGWRDAGDAAEEPARRRRRSLLLVAAFLAAYVPYFAWRCWYYGDVLPNTFYAKASGFSWGRIVRGGNLLAEVADWWSVYPLLAIAAAALPTLRSRRSLQLAAAYVAVTAVYFAYVGGDFLSFFGPRFLMPALPFLLLLASEGLGNLCGWAGAWGGSAGPARRRGWRITVAAAGAAMLLANAHWRSWPARHFNRLGISWLMASQEDLGRYLGATAPPDALLADGTAGIVPFYSHLANIDMYGLADLHIGHMRPLPVGFKMVAHEKYDPRYVLRRRPDLLVSYFDRQRTPRAAGLPRVKDWLWACYRPLLLVRDHPNPDGSWLLPSRVITNALWDDGYRIAVMERRHGRGAAHCAAYEDE
jgi:arabinofuranosyltransferase